jgi:hypothetical protein
MSTNRGWVTQDDLIALVTEHLAPLEQWASRCHEASLKLVRDGVLGLPCRVARGGCSGVGGQHSWVVLGMDVYDKRALVVDATWWSYNPTVKGVWVGRNMRTHSPHGRGSIWNAGRPMNAEENGEPVFELAPEGGWSPDAQRFLDMIGPMSRKSWIQLAHLPMEDWPAAEIIGAMARSELSGYVPIDIVGMVTLDNPSGLYLPDPVIGLSFAKEFTDRDEYERHAYGRVLTDLERET